MGRIEKIFGLLLGADGVDAEVGRGDGVKEGAQIDGALSSKRRRESPLRLRPSLRCRTKTSSTGLGEPQLFAPAIAASPLDGDQTVTPSGRIFRPRVVRSMTISAARALIVIGPSRRSFANIENCVVRSPLAARN
jgi:hypothetical protein